MDQQQAELRELRLNEDTADTEVHKEVLARRKEPFTSSTVWTRITSDSLTLHLARASVLENASMCLHPVYGFPYLPGTGLKGLARSWAETVWADGQPDAKKAWDRIHEVFGVGDETDKDKRWKPAGVVRKKSDEENGEFVDSVGVVVFHDAWPTKPPKLQIDFATPHHKRYYEKNEPAGDWDNPEPAAFLSVPSDTEFEFAISATSRCADPALVEEARKWLDDALTIFGAGAKTNAGYGTFKPLNPASYALPASRFVTSTHQLTLTTPAFFAGDQSDPRSCRLRGGTLRGLLRWWWRTMHAGYLSAEELHELEKKIWGGIAAESDEGSGSAVSIRIQLKSSQAPRRFDREALRMDFKLPWTERGERKTPGLTFLSYGTDENGRRRFYLPAGATWELSIRARATDKLDAGEVHREATNALWLLTHFGGLGAKSGKGFGCLSQNGDDDQSAASVNTGLASALKFADQTRRKLGLARPFRLHEAVPGGWNACVQGTPQEFPLGKMPPEEQGIWAAIHRLGTAIRIFSSANKHKPEKRALGTPRTRLERDGRNWPERHTSPVHYYLFQRDSQYWVRVVAFPSTKLPDFDFSRKYLANFISDLQTNLAELAAQNPVTGRAAARMDRIPDTPAPTPTRAPALTAGTNLTGVLSEQKTRSGGWKATVNGVIGVIQNSNRVPPDALPGQRVKLKVKIAMPNTAFEYIGPAEE